MVLETIDSGHGYGAPCIHELGGQKRVLIASHGFGSGAQSQTNMQLLRALPPAGIGVVCYDFPCHGKSEAGWDALRIDECMDCLGAVERDVRRRCPDAEIIYFGSSFGAYITALYLSQRSHAGTRAFFRSAAVTMPDIMLGSPFPGVEEALKEKGWFLLDLPGYTRPLEITSEFLDDLRSHNLFEKYKSDASIAMIHGDADEVAPYEAAVRFAEKTGAKLITVPGGHHNLGAEGQGEMMLNAVLEFINNRG